MKRSSNNKQDVTNLYTWPRFLADLVWIVAITYFFVGITEALAK